jgi:redox-sensing transcriptional repressor
LEKQGEMLCSSHQLAGLLHLNPAQVRKDLAYFGEFGKRGVGYAIPKLREQIIKILGLKQIRPVGLIGAGGRLGQALALYRGFEKRNFRVVALFDKDPFILRQSPMGLGKIHPVEELPRIAKELGIEMVILTVPAEAAFDVYEIIQLSTVKAILNFAPVQLPSTDEIVVHNVDLTMKLESLSYYLNCSSLPESLSEDDFSED